MEVNTHHLACQALSAGCSASFEPRSYRSITYMVRHQCAHDFANHLVSISPLQYVVECHDAENQANDVSQERQYGMLVHEAAMGLELIG